MRYKKLVLLVQAVLALTGLCAQPRYKYKTEEVARDIYVLKPEINDHRWVTSNIVFIINVDGVFVVDSGLLPSAAEEAIAEIKKLTAKPVRYLLNTHWHGDHWQGNESFVKAYPGIKIIASEKNKEAIGRNGMVWLNVHYPVFLNQMLAEYQKTLNAEKNGKKDELNAEEEKTLEEGIEDMKKDIDEIKQVKPVLPNTTFDKKMIIKAGKRVIELHYLGVGNTIGDVVAWLPREKLLVAGDLVVHPSPYESGAFSQDWIETSRKLQHNFKYSRLIPGHGEVQHDTTYLSYLNALYTEIAQQMDAAYRNGKSKIEDVQAAVTYQTVTDALNRNEVYKQYTQKLEKDFIPAAIRSSFASVRNGIMKG